jgi:predicted dehydrogenase
MSMPLEAVLIGAGQRGAQAYAPFALQYPERLRFVAVAEPDPDRRQQFAAQHNIPAGRQFCSWEELLSRPRPGQVALICTQDWQHTNPTMAAIERGYHILLEKPMATTAAECRQVVQASEAAGLQLHICHVLRYTPHFQKMREIIQSGILGQMIDVNHRENVSFWHMAHSYVRGNWCNKEKSSPMILAKCSHDFDILLWLLDRDCRHLTSIGALSHFRPENAPPGAPARCLDGCPAAQECPYYAPWIYQEMIPFWRSFAETAEGFSAAAVRAHLSQPGAVRGLSMLKPELRQITDYRGWPLSVLANNPTPEKIDQALREGPYGRCVYHCDNDVVDHQVVLMQFEEALTVTLTMHGHSHVECRTTRIEGTRGRLRAIFGSGGSYIIVEEHRSGRRTRYNTSAEAGAGHGGGDHALMAAFLESIESNEEAARTTARQSLRSHLMAFAAEQARLETRIITAEDFS